MGKNLFLGVVLGFVSFAGTFSANAAPLSSEDVQSVSKAHFPEISSCYHKYALDQNTAEGTVDVKAVVLRDGSLEEVQIIAPGVKGKKFSRCVRKSVVGWDLPRIDYATDVHVPFFFLHTKADDSSRRRARRGSSKKRKRQDS